MHLCQIPLPEVMCHFTDRSPYNFFYNVIISEQDRCDESETVKTAEKRLIPYDPRTIVTIVLGDTDIIEKVKWRLIGEVAHHFSQRYLTKVHDCRISDELLPIAIITGIPFRVQSEII